MVKIQFLNSIVSVFVPELASKIRFYIYLYVVVMICDKLFVHSYCVWAAVEIGAIAVGEENNVEERNGMASLC